MTTMVADSWAELSSARKGDEMTEVVTSSAAVPQLNLLAQRQQVFVVERAGNAPDDVTLSSFVKDGLHMNPEGYRIWISVLTPYLDATALRPAR